MKKVLSFFEKVGLATKKESSLSIKKQSETDIEMSSIDIEEVEERSKVDVESHTSIFNPSLHMQRHCKIIEYLQEMKPSKVIDFGCSTLGLTNILRHETYIRELNAVDIDMSVLESSMEKLTPKAFDYLQPRSKPLHVKVYNGSIADKDSRLKNVDVLVAVELIEHLYPDTLEKVPENIFGYIRPKHVILTTPNSEYNVIFNNKKSTKFRHWDHKFEWTREEFEKWCKNICLSYGYKARFEGVGDPNKTHPNVGYCSQIAVFERLSDCCDSNQLKDDDNRCYELVKEVEYPFRTAENIVMQMLNAVENLLSREGFRLGSADEMVLQANHVTNIHSRTFGRSLVYAYPKVIFSKSEHEVFYNQFIADGDDFWEHARGNDKEENLYGQEVERVEVLPYKPDSEHQLGRAFMLKEKAKSAEPDDGQFDDVDYVTSDSEFSSSSILPEFPCLVTVEVVVNSQLTVDLCLTRVSVSEDWCKTVVNEMIITDGFRIFVSYEFLEKLKKVAHFPAESNEALGDHLSEVFHSRSVEFDHLGISFDVTLANDNEDVRSSSSSWRSDEKFNESDKDSITSSGVEEEEDCFTLEEEEDWNNCS